MRISTIKSIGAIALTGAGSALVLGFRTTGGDATLPVGGNAANAGNTSVSGTSSSSGSSSGSTKGSSSGSTGSSSGSGSSARYADGTWTGTAVEEPWGPFEVQVVVRGGKITDVSVVESPGDRHSSRINSVAVPLLTESTMAKQTATTDMVSGATWTSDSYAQSLQSALDKASAA
jgi:uncharacterized protein with FMN-binding domain